MRPCQSESDQKVGEWWFWYKPEAPHLMGVSKNSGTPKSSILIGFSIINHPFWGTPIFGNILIPNFYPPLKLTTKAPEKNTILKGSRIIFQPSFFQVLFGWFHRGKKLRLVKPWYKKGRGFIQIVDFCYPSFHNHGSVKNACISNRIVIFQILRHFPLNPWIYGRKSSFRKSKASPFSSFHEHPSVSLRFRCTSSPSIRSDRSIHLSQEAKLASTYLGHVFGHGFLDV